MNEELDQNMIKDLERIRRIFNQILSDSDGMVLNNVIPLSTSVAFGHLRALLRAFYSNWHGSDPERVRSSLRDLRDEVRAFRLPDDLDTGYNQDDYVAQVEEVKHNLYALIDDLLNESQSPGQPMDLIKWKGSVQVLAWLLRELAVKGWIDAPSHAGTTTRYTAGDINASKYAKAMAPHFQEVNRSTLERELKPEGGTVPAQDVEEFRIPQRPD